MTSGAIQKGVPTNVYIIVRQQESRSSQRDETAHNRINILNETVSRYSLRLLHETYETLEDLQRKYNKPCALKRCVLAGLKHQNLQPVKQYSGQFQSGATNSALTGEMLVRTID